MLQKNRRTLSRSRVQTLAYHFEVLWTDCLAGFAMSSTVSFVVGRHESWRAGLLAYANFLRPGTATYSDRSKSGHCQRTIETSKITQSGSRAPPGE